MAWVHVVARVGQHHFQWAETLAKCDLPLIIEVLIRQYDDREFFERRSYFNEFGVVQAACDIDAFDPSRKKWVQFGDVYRHV